MEPVLDVVIPVRDRADWLSTCVASLIAFTENAWRLIILDNDSEEQHTTRLLDRLERDERPRSQLTGVTVIRRRVNDSFSASVNAGVEAGSAPYVAILNSDVVVTPGWDSIMLGELGPNTAGLVGASTNAASGLQSDPNLAQVLKPPFLIFFCVMTKREIWNRVGPLDDVTFHDWSGGEDLDWSWRCVEHGYELLVSSAWVMHGCSQTYRLFCSPEEQATKHQAANQRLAEKWGPERYFRGTKVGIHVALGIPSGSPEVQAGFCENLLRLRHPGITMEIFWIKRHATHMAREVLAERVAARDTSARPFDYLVMVDDDMRFPSDLIQRLIGPQLDVVGCVAYQRKAPHIMCVFDYSAEANGYVPLERIENSGLRKVGAVGFGAVAISAEALRKVKQPRFEWNKTGEDLDFCTKAREVGLEVWCNTDLILGHVGDPVVVDAEYVKAFKRQQEGLGG